MANGVSRIKLAEMAKKKSKGSALKSALGSAFSPKSLLKVKGNEKLK